MGLSAQPPRPPKESQLRETPTRNQAIDAARTADPIAELKPSVPRLSPSCPDIVRSSSQTQLANILRLGDTSFNRQTANQVLDQLDAYKCRRR